MRRERLLALVLGICLGLILVVTYLYSDHLLVKERITWKVVIDRQMTLSHTDTPKKVYNITWYNPPADFFFWPAALYGGFKTCEYSNCLMKFDKKTANQSDAVIFDGRSVQPNAYFNRKPGQIWIYATIEAPTYLWVHGNHWTRGDWFSGFNWTMSYDNSNADIYLPYGKIVKKEGTIQPKNYNDIFRHKNRTALIVHTNCNPPSKRQEYVKQLSKYVDIESLGGCGKPWKCGQLYKHDNCFQIINRFKFYLAFENSFCNQYFTEKIFRNFNYDSLMVIQGGRDNDTERIFPEGTYISTKDFKTPRELAEYLNKVAKSEEMYINLLKRKEQFYSIPYEKVYIGAMCQLCERMNNQDIFK